MIDDESEPSLFRDLENNLSCGLSTSESSEFTCTTDADEEQTTNLERKTSISLYNVSSTPHVFKPLKKCRFRTGSHLDLDSDYEYKPKRKKYDHIESKVKQYRNEIRKQSEYRRALRQQQEDELKKELENNLRVSEPHEHKNHSMKFLPNVITNEEFKNNLLYLSPIVNSNDENDTVFIESIELKEKYNQALSEIENLQIEIMKLKAAKSTTPRLSRQKSLQSSMIKTCLFKNSSTGNRQNTLQNNTIGGDSTCRSIDIDDLISPPTFNNAKTDGPPENNPFITKTRCASPTSNSITNSSVPLLIDYETRRPRKNSLASFFNNFIKCPTMEFLHKLKPERKNRIAPIIPYVVISSPNSEKSCAGSFEFVAGKYYDETLLDSPKQVYSLQKQKYIFLLFLLLFQKLLLKEMTDCCEELTEKIDRFKKLVNDYLNKSINNNNNNNIN